MTQPIFQPHMTERGVAFSVVTGMKRRECLISLEALQRMAALKNVDAGDADPMDVFHAFETTIDGVARRFIAAGERSRPFCLKPDCFGDIRAPAPR